jgi:hypothetical protein
MVAPGTFDMRVNIRTGGLAAMIPMMNMYETIRDNLHFNKFTVGELLFRRVQVPH